MKKSTLYGFIALILAAAIVIACGVGSSWFTNGNLKTWFNGWGYGVDNSVNDGSNDGNTSGDLVNEVESNGISLAFARIAVEEYADYGIEAQADTAYTITATVNSDASDTSIIGGISWKNASGNWSNGKSISDYATVTQTTEYGLNFTLTIKQAFGEPIIFTAASRYDSAVNAVLQVDYLKDLQGFIAVLNPSLPSSSVSRIYVGDTKTNTISIDPIYGTGTVTGTISNYRTTFTVTENTRTYLNAALAAGNGTQAFHAVETFVTTGETFKIPFLYPGLVGGGGNEAGAKTIINNYIAQYGGTDGGTGPSRAGVSSIKYEVTYSYNDEYSKDVTSVYTGSGYTAFRSDSVTLINTVTSIQLDKDNILVLPS